MTQRQDYWALMQRLGELEDSGLTQVEKAEELGVSQARVSIVERIRKTGTPELKVLIQNGDLPADALKYLPLADAYAEAEWAEQMRAATSDQRRTLVRQLKDRTVGISPPSLKAIMLAVAQARNSCVDEGDKHLLGLISGIGYALGYLDFESAQDMTGQLQLQACEKLCKGRKPGQYHWIRNFFSGVVASEEF